MAEGISQHEKRKVLKQLRSMTAKDVANHVKDDLGFPQYADMFIKQDISGEELPSLVKQDLIDMGIISVGHRLQILEDFHTLRAARAAEMRTTKLHTWSEFGWYCCNCYPRTFKLTQAAIKMEKNYCCTVCGYEDQIDMTAVTDVQIDRGCCWSRITVESNDPTTPILSWIQGKNSALEVMRSIRIAMESNQDRMANIRGDRAAAK